MIVAAQPASAQEPEPIDNICPGFSVTIEGTEGNQQEHVLTDKNGDTVTLLTGTSGSVVFTNVTSGETFTLRSRGTAIRTTENGDGTNTVEVSGHFVLALFPGDVPAGPSTTLYEGRVVYTDSLDPAGTDTLLETRGKRTDICAELASSQPRVNP
jgi:hypothetical protein